MDIFNVIKQYKKNKLTKKRIIDLLSAKGFQGTTVYYIKQEDNVIEMEIGLPPHKERINVQTQLLKNLQQEFKAEDGEISKANGKFITMRFGTKKLYKVMNWSPTMLKPNTCKVLFISSYGDYCIDLEEDVSAHGIIGAAAGFGKSVAMQHIMLSVYVQNYGNVDLYISSVKLEDYYPFFDCKNVNTIETRDEMLVLLTSLKDEYERRKRLLRRKEMLHAKDSKSVKKLYPEYYKDFRPIFVFIDEFARFSGKGNEDIIKLVDELVAVTRYLNIHFWFATQRPSANDVFTPAIRQNCSCRIGFYCENRANSEMVIGKGGCESLPKISGRGILIDKEERVMQTPFLETTDAYSILNPFRKSGIHEGKRSESDSTITEIQSNDTQSNSLPGVSECELSNSDSKSDIETFIPTWTD